MVLEGVVMGARWGPDGAGGGSEGWCWRGRHKPGTFASPGARRRHSLPPYRMFVRGTRCEHPALGRILYHRRLEPSPETVAGAETSAGDENCPSSRP
eukprot:7363434-Pyramimonas_sp.AAC.1